MSSLKSKRFFSLHTCEGSQDAQWDTDGPISSNNKPANIAIFLTIRKLSTDRHNVEERLNTLLMGESAGGVRLSCNRWKLGRERKEGTTYFKQLKFQNMNSGHSKYYYTAL